MSGPNLEVVSGGEPNHITISGGRVHDATAPVTVGDSCWLEDPNTAYCPGDSGVLVVLAGAGDDEVLVQDRRHSTLYGEDGDDVLEATGGTNWFIAGPGADRFVGGPGYDIYSHGWERGDPDAAGVNVSLNDLPDDGLPGEGDNVDSAFEVLVGSEGDDVLDLDGVPDGVAHGGSGADRLIGGPGRQTLVGENDADVLVGGGGDDLLVDVDEESCPFSPIVPGCPPAHSGDPDAPNDLDGGDGADVLRGNVGDDTLDGGPGDDLLAGDHGADDVHGGAGTDTAPTDFQGLGYYPPPDLPVAVSLDDVADDGADTDRHLDNLHSDIEEILGTGAADRLIGSPG